MNAKVQNLLNDWLMTHPELQPIALAARGLILQCADQVSDEVKYGGILFAAPVPFCGVFVYKQHVTVEFSHGALMADPHGLLEGKGKGRRHLKLHTLADVQDKHLADYLPLALVTALQAFIAAC
ncbi:hypothetical protein CK621_05735 [Vandammella animalimorsus]|uniref:YdhG-like domain-containing protein n=1 Tax=Vandammella animalimorsus TaxID=2029117 RepID=A0A2A2AWS4_9BURK|nr:hypothetical protein CK621_05735 [Vandammella animalimorsus]